MRCRRAGDDIFATLGLSLLGERSWPVSSGCFCRVVNWRRHRTGPLWDGRNKSCVVQDVTYLLVCQRYIELNPVRAGMVRYPGHYRCSSYRRNAEGREDFLVQPHPL